MILSKFRYDSLRLIILVDQFSICIQCDHPMGPVLPEAAFRVPPGRWLLPGLQAVTSKVLPLVLV